MRYRQWHGCPEGEREIGDDLDLITPEDVRNRWIDELRYGRHKQCIGYLRKRDENGDYSYDALGVLCLACIKIGIDDISDEEWEQVYPPKRTLLAAGISVRDDEYDGVTGSELKVIEEVNDRGDTFNQIAYLLEFKRDENMKGRGKL